MKDHRLAVSRVFLLATFLALLPVPVTSQADLATVQVVRVIDGDTIRVCCVFGDRVTVRYIGIDTPETKHPTKEVEPYGTEASEANRKLVEGKTVRLEFDMQQFYKYGRILAYIFLEDGTFVNAWLVEKAPAAIPSYNKFTVGRSESRK
jgi:endonuclease YncB( thermonuclease family)